MQWHLLSKRQAERVLPRALAFGKLDQAIQELEWCFLSTPLGTHLEQVAWNCPPGCSHPFRELPIRLLDLLSA